MVTKSGPQKEIHTFRTFSTEANNRTLSITVDSEVSFEKMKDEEETVFSFLLRSKFGWRY